MEISGKRHRIIADENIPFLRNRMEKEADVAYLGQEEINAEAVADADALIIRTRTICNQNLLDDSAVKLIATATIGTDHIDLPYCQRRGIKVENSPGCNAPGVAQYVWSALLNLGFDPEHDKLGIIGCGNVGSIVAEWGLILGTEILVSDPPKSEAAHYEGTEPFPAIKDAGGSIREASVEEILKECDAITLHTPLTLEGNYPTFHLIDADRLAAMKKGAIIINAARGGVVDNAALRNELKTGRIRAVLDTWEKEPSIDKELLSLTSIATPHIAGYSRQGKERATRMVLEAISRNLGIKTDISGLSQAYRLPQELTPDKIKESYNPFADDSNLRRNPDQFEQLRHDYDYREEV